MASGVEMLGQMSETEALAGPVQGGNMVVKPNEVPVGGAAMLAKALRGQANKGIGGIYELPSQKAVTPEFMQMAEQNVKTQEAEQRNRYPNNFADDEGGILVLPRNLRTAPGVPQTSLAYITDEEKAILGLLKPGTPHRGPEEVPSYDSLDYVADESGSNQGATESSYDSGGSSYDNISVGQGNWNFGGTPGSGNQQGDSGTGEGTQSYNDYYDKYEASVGTPDEVGVTTDDFSGGSNMGSTVAANVAQQMQEEQQEQQKIEKELEKLNNKKNLTDTDKKEKSRLTKILEGIKAEGTKLIDSGLNLFGDSEQKKKDKARIEELLKLAEGDKYNLSGSQRRELEKLQLNTSMAPAVVKAIGNFAAGIAGPEEDQFADDNYLNILESEILPKYGSNRDEAIEAFAKEYDDRIPGQNIGPDDQDFGTYDPAKSLKMLLDNKGDIKPGSDLEKRLNPVDYYRNNQPQTSGGLTDMAQNLTMADIKNSGLKPVEQRRLSARLMEAREAASKDRGGNQNNRPRFMQETQEEVIETPTGVIDEEAQTMKYTSPRTGDKEIDVPLQRRFRTDPTQDVAQYRTAPRTESDILKYMTQGTTGEGIQLEPFSEYQRRRRKAMGLDPLEMYG